MAFKKQAIGNPESLKTQGGSDREILKLELGQEVTVRISDVTVYEKTTKINKEGEKSKFVGLIVLDDEGNEAIMSGGLDTVFGKQMLSFAANKNEDTGEYTLKPELKDAKVRVAKVANQSAAGNTYHTFGYELL
jgi:hypothetical protein